MESRDSQRKDYLAFHGRALPKNTRQFVRGLIGLSGYAWGISTTDLGCAGFDFVLSLQETWGVSAFYVVLHLDEVSPHFHFLSANYSYTGHQTLLRNLSRGDFSWLQDLAGACFAPVGYVRGQPRSVTHARHKNVAELHRFTGNAVEKAKARREA